MSTPYAPTARRPFIRVAGAVAVACALSAGSVLVLDTATATTAAAAGVAPETMPAAQMPFYAHMPNPTAAEIKKRIDAGWATGAFLYYSAGDTFGWGDEWEALEEAFPNGVDIFVSPKTFTTESLTDWCEQLSPAQRAKTVFAYFQEPEDNHLTDEARADFRAKVVQAADIVQPYGIRNGIELQSWTLNDMNANEWGGRANFKAFIPRDKSSVDFVGISLYDEHQNFSGPEQLRPVANVIENQLPNAEWGPVASGWSVPVGTPMGSELRDVRTDAANDAFDYALRRGATALGWWDWDDWDGRDYGVRDTVVRDMLRTF